MLVVVVRHLTLSWPRFLALSDSTTDALEWALASTRWSLGLFFLMAGFFGALLLRRWGTARFIRDRLRRIGIPLAFAVLVIVPLAEPILHAVRPELDATPVPAHVWFLWYVLVLYVVAIVLLRAPWIDRGSAATAKLVASPLAVPLLAAVTAALLIGARALSMERPRGWYRGPSCWPSTARSSWWGCFSKARRRGWTRGAGDPG